MSIEAMKQALKALEVATTPLARDRQEVLRAQAALCQAIEQYQKQDPLDFSRGWHSGYEYSELRFKNSFEQSLRLAITEAVEKAGVEAFKRFMNDYKTGAEK
jgi:ribulose bisphosphate carboxylase small subunit